jgi:hypothetical protein
MTSTPEPVSPLVPIDVPGITRVAYRAYPIVDHIADKVCALLEVHQRAVGRPIPSARYRDLADHVIFAHNTSPSATDLQTALASETRRRALPRPDHVPTPAGTGWPAGYRRVARDVPNLVERDLDTALDTARHLINPVLDGRAAGHWDPARLSWPDPSQH